MTVVTISLRAIAVLYWLAAVANVVIAKVDSPAISGERNSAHWYWAAFRNFVIAGLCFAAQQIMPKGKLLATGAAFLLSVALMMTVFTWVAARRADRNPLPLIEPLIVWPVLLFGIAIAYKQSRR